MSEGHIVPHDCARIIMKKMTRGNTSRPDKRRKSFVPVLVISLVATLSLAAPMAADAQTVLLQDNFDSENGGVGTEIYNRFSNWDVPDGSVDLIGNGLYDFYPGNGLYVDLDGLSSGRMVSKDTFSLSEGTCELSFKLGGSTRGDTNSVDVFLGDVFAEGFTLASDEPLEVVTRTFDVSSDRSAKLVFDHTRSGDNTYGLILDDVALTCETTEPMGTGSTTVSIPEGYVTPYNSIYDTVDVLPDEGDPCCTVSPATNLYRPGDEIKVTGYFSQSLLGKLKVQADFEPNNGDPCCAVALQNTAGQTLAENEMTFSGSEGKFIGVVQVPTNVPAAPYKLKVASGDPCCTAVMEMLDDDTLAALNAGASADLVIASSAPFAIQAEEQDFTVHIASNSLVDDFAFDQTGKRLSFAVEGETGTSGVAQVTVPKSLLSGQVMVTIDGKAVTDNSVIMPYDTDSDFTLEINYGHSRHIIELLATNVVPEFPITVLIMAAAIGSIIMLSTIMARKRGGGLFSGAGLPK